MLPDLKTEDFQAVTRFREHFQIHHTGAEWETLLAIIQAFQHLPYENITKILKLRQYLGEEERFRTPLEVIEDYIRFGAGGTCFSLTHTLATILKVEGFNCYPVMGHMAAGRNEHCALVVLRPEGSFLVDPGYILNYPFPLNKKPCNRYKTAFNIVELYYRDAEEYELYTVDGTSRKWRYSFRNQPVEWPEFYRFWKESFHRRTMHALCLSRLTEKGLIYFRKNYIQRTYYNKRERGYIHHEIHTTVGEIFSIDPRLVKKAEQSLKDTLQWDIEHNYFTPRRKKDATN